MKMLILGDVMGASGREAINKKLPINSILLDQFRITDYSNI